MLDPADYETWLTAPVDVALNLQRPYPAQKMRLAFTSANQDEAA